MTDEPTTVVIIQQKTQQNLSHVDVNWVCTTEQNDSTINYSLALSYV